MALLSFRGIDTPSLPAQGEQRRSSYFNISRGNPSSNGPLKKQRRNSEATDLGFGSVQQSRVIMRILLSY
jgi:hypothetical protein